MARRFIVSLALVALAADASAAQIVALDMKAVGGAPKELAASLTPMMIAEVGRRDGISVVSQFEIKALLEHEGNKQAVGCDDMGCMTQIAGAMGAELVLASTLGKVGEDWVVTLTLFNAETAVPTKRATGKEKGSPSAASIAVAAAINNLFRDGLPADLQGPGSMSRRGFEAVLLGFGKAVLDPAQKPRALRKRIIHDLIATELDFDANPKMDMLDLAVRRGIGDIDRRSLLARDEADMQRYLNGRRQWVAINMDLQRVKEIRTRARERGVVPSARAIRFEEPDPGDAPDEAAVAGYVEEAEKGAALVGRAIGALITRNRKQFAAQWIDPERGERQFDREVDEAERYGYRYELLPFHATPPWLYQRAIDALDDGKLNIFLRRFKKGEINDDDTVYLERAGKKWRIRSW
jgi:hypothetical protein